MSSVDDNQRASFETLLRPHLDRLYRLSYRLTGNKPEAEDLFQDVLTKVFPKLDSLVEIEEPGSWLCRIMYNHFIDNRRRYARQRLVAVSEDQLPGQGIDSVAGDLDPEADAVQRDSAGELEDALQVLSEEHRMIVLLHDCEGYKLTEIQELMNVPVGTLKSRLHRARARLRDILVANGTFSSI
jgi:RNA polymerase sigma-70 factor (ECF subfamily)